MQNVNLIVALQSALCNSILALLALKLCSIYQLSICALVLIISNVEQIVNLIVTCSQHSVAVYLNNINIVQ